MTHPMAQEPPILLPLIDGSLLALPPSEDVLTTYVIKEQLDFFEDELPFVRSALRSGDYAIDIGANYGCYTTAIARTVGATGKVWAIEPTPETASYLRHSIDVNNFRQVAVIQKAVSNRTGVAYLRLHANAELNAIVTERTNLDCTAVPVTTLDELQSEHQWDRIDFVKIDAEGQEQQILEGAKTFFSRHHPLVQYEVKSPGADNQQMLQRLFCSHGLKSYRLIPGLGALQPLDEETPADPYQLNIFCCSSDRASRLASNGKLVQDANAFTGQPIGANEPSSTPSDPIEYLCRFPYAAPYRTAWSRQSRDAEARHFNRFLGLYIRAHDTRLPLARRASSLALSFKGLQSLASDHPTPQRLASLARVALEFGERAAAIDSLNGLLLEIKEHGIDLASEPLLSPWPRYDELSTEPSPEAWLVAATLEHLELRERFSSYYAGPEAISRLGDIVALGFNSPAIERRLALLHNRMARAPRIPPRRLSAI